LCRHPAHSSLAPSRHSPSFVIEFLIHNACVCVCVRLTVVCIIFYSPCMRTCVRCLLGILNIHIKFEIERDIKKYKQHFLPPLLLLHRSSRELCLHKPYSEQSCHFIVNFFVSAASRVFILFFCYFCVSSRVGSLSLSACCHLI
jgi:hypothetical protein